MNSFRELHEGPDLLVLPNCWDAGSARLMESLGAKAIATTSAGVAWTHAYPDGDVLPIERLIATVRSIARAIRVPLTIDMEGGYADDPAVVAKNVAAVVDAGAAGINIEDGTGPPELLAAKIRAVKRVSADVFVNVRTDVYLRGLAPEAGRVGEVLARAACYRDAGADGIFVPGLCERGEIREIAASTGLPLNVMAWSGLPLAGELVALGVRRLSAGSAIAQILYSRAAKLARGFLADGSSEPLAEDAMPYAEINAFFQQRKTQNG